MDDATYVLFADRAHRLKLRDRIRELADETVRWSERRHFGRSEFIIVGPPARARQVHEMVTLWLSREQFQPR